MRKNLFFMLFLTAVLLIGLSSAAVSKINYPRDNDILIYSQGVNLNVSSSGSTNCVFFYATTTGIVPYNQSVLCNGLTLVNLPSADGIYNITVQDDAGSSQTNTITISKPSGILVTFIYAVSFLIVLSMLFIFILNLAKFIIADTTIYNVAVSWTVYFGLLISYQLSQEYLNIPLVMSWIDLFMSVGGWLLVVFPVIAFVVSFIKKGVDKKNVPNPQEITGRQLLKYG